VFSRLTRRSALAGLAGAFAVSGCALADQGAKEPPLEPLTVVSANGEHRFMVEVADTEEERTRGLMFRESLAADRGMLFKFPDERERSFWMRNTYIALDIVYIDATGSIVSIARDTVPFSEASIPSYGAAKGVLEVNAGTADRLGWQAGDRVEHPFFSGR
jgi:uncharacterized membrane protein (UPF0127 family)